LYELPYKLMAQDDECSRAHKRTNVNLPKLIAYTKPPTERQCQQCRNTAPEGKRSPAGLDPQNGDESKRYWPHKVQQQYRYLGVPHRLMA
jgi:hypothetical protein